MTTAYTPGTWTAVRTKYRTLINCHDGSPVAQCDSSLSDADMALIAAAPDLLAALQALVKLHHDWDKGRAFISVAFYEENQKAIAQARAAIARALGKA